jgi:hypothetical protein
MPKAQPPSQILKYQGKRDWPLVPGIDDWGLTTEQQVLLDLNAASRLSSETTDTANFTGVLCGAISKNTGV